MNVWIYTHTHTGIPLKEFGEKTFRSQVGRVDIPSWHSWPLWVRFTSLRNGVSSTAVQESGHCIVHAPRRFRRKLLTEITRPHCCAIDTWYTFHFITTKITGRFFSFFGQERTIITVRIGMQLSKNFRKTPFTRESTAVVLLTISSIPFAVSSAGPF